MATSHSPAPAARLHWAKAARHRSAGVVVGKMIVNGNILADRRCLHGDSPERNGTVPSVVQLNGQNTFATMTLSSASNTTTTADANLQIGSSSIPDGVGGITSGPLGTGLVTVSGGGNPAIEAVGGARTVDNPIGLLNLQTILNVRGSNDLTLTGAIGGVNNNFGGLSKDGTGKLTLTNTGDYIGPTTVNGGTMLVNGCAYGHKRCNGCCRGDARRQRQHCRSGNEQRHDRPRSERRHARTWQFTNASAMRRACRSNWAPASAMI